LIEWSDLIWIEQMNYAQRLVLTLRDALEMPARMFDALQYIPSIREELKAKYAHDNNK
jgi:hypothetical protein